jgi:hypothetical protein
MLSQFMAPERFEDSSSASIEKAVRRLLRLLYAGINTPTNVINDFIPPKEERNREIYRRFLAGARAVDLAELYNVSLQRIYALIRRYNRR